MGFLRHRTSGHTVILAAHNVAGRAPGSAVRLTDPSASNDHASVFWVGDRWNARDLGSTNGTFVNDVRVQPKENAVLVPGAVLRFGVGAEVWELIDERGPSILARSRETGEERVAEDGLLALPDADNIKVSVSIDPAGVWTAEWSDGTRRPVHDGEQITIDGQTWEFTAPPASPVIGTYEDRPPPALATIVLQFYVSRDEEHVRLEALDGDKVLALGERSNFYLLLFLARARLKDAEELSLPEAEQGWRHMDDVTEALAIDEQRVNVIVYRIRKVFANARVEGYYSIIERRAREIRIGTGHFNQILA